MVKSKELTGSHEYVDIFILIYRNNLGTMFTLFALLIKICKKKNQYNFAQKSFSSFSITILSQKSF